MGRDKSRLRFSGRTLLAHVKRAAESTGLPVRVIRRDLVPRCGPLGGVFTALTQTKMAHVLFLPCDMPLISEALIRWVLKNSQAIGNQSGRRRTTRNAFVVTDDGAGFPFVLDRDVLPIVAAQIERRRFSLQLLAKELGAAALQPPPRMRKLLRNVNTPEEWSRLFATQSDQK